MNRQKVVIIGGGGMVGSTAAYSMALQNTVEEIVMIDRTPEKCWGHAADINDAMGLDSGVVVRQGEYADIESDDIVVITAGSPQLPGQTRLELIAVNAEIIRDIIRQIMSGGAKPYILVVSNPVDALTYVALKESGLPKNRVMGTGTTLDTSRLRVMLADQLNVNSREVDAYILGEHGDSSFSTINSAQVGEIPIRQYPGFTEEMIENIDQKVRERAYRVIETKQSTYYGIGQIITKIVSALRHNSHSVFPVCSLAEGEYGLQNVVVGLPSIVSSDGVKILAGFPLDQTEQAALRRSADVVADAIASL